MNFLKRAALSLWSRKARTLLTFSTLVVISVMVLAGVLIKDATARASDAARQKIGAEVGLDVDMDALASSGQLQAPQIRTDTVDRIGRSPLVRKYTYQSFDGASLKGGLKLPGKPLYPEGPTSTLAFGVLDSSLQPDFASGTWKLLSGRPITGADRDRNVVLIEERLARKNNLKTGDRITLGENDPKGRRTAEFTVQGVYRDPSDEQDPEYGLDPANRLFVTAGALSRLNGEQETIARSASFQLRDPAAFEQFKKEAEEAAGDALDGFALGINDKALRQMTGPLSSVAGTATAAMWLIGIAGAAVLALLAMLAVKQRRTEFGVLLALGERKGKLVAQQVVEVLVLAVLAVGLSSLFAQTLTERAGNALVRGEASAAQRKLDAWQPPPPGSTGLQEGTDWDAEPVADADPIDRITVRLDDGALATVAGLGLATGLLATALPAASVLRLSPRSILSKGK
ncbi:ABC transporter permease [Streptomyces indicus]|uniref:Putative ABC transport system permease protein n=1 Tax=Streptomyces indicus TaxID=417292 RepID=A0A1G9DEJ5_9ACTN|nr:ABC transporter permease [Streptomyces indicus]SDK62277.1 putative ABC transport system permease protein [Streptomyces indicus]